MQSLQKFLPKYTIALALLFIATVIFLMTRGNTVDIEVDQVTNAELVQAIYATGFVEAEAVANLSAETSGTVRFVGALEGEHVTAGQKILQFSSPQPEFAVREAKAALAEQQAQTHDNKLRRTRKENLFRQVACSNPNRLFFEFAVCNFPDSALCVFFKERAFSDQKGIRSDIVDDVCCCGHTCLNVGGWMVELQIDP